jgi:hypothetical protein
MISAPLTSFLVSVTVFQRRDRVYGLKTGSFSINTGYGKEPVAIKEHNVQSKSSLCLANGARGRPLSLMVTAGDPAAHTAYVRTTGVTDAVRHINALAKKARDIR